MIRTPRNSPTGHTNGFDRFLGVDPDFDDVEGVEAWAVDTIGRCGTLDTEYSSPMAPSGGPVTKWDTVEPEPEVVESTPAQHDFTALDEYFSRPRPVRLFNDAPEVVPDPVKAAWADNAGVRVAVATEALESNIDFVMAHTGVDRDAAIQYLNRKP